MTKLYKSLKAEDSPQAIKKFKEAQKYFRTFQKNWEKWYMQELLKSKAGKDESYYKEQVRVEAWRAEMSINSILPTEYDRATDNHVSPAPWLLDNPRYSKGDTRKNKIFVYQKAFKKAFTAIENLIHYEADDVNLLKDTEQHTIAGINVLVSGKREDEDWGEKYIKPFLQNLPKAVKLIKKSGLQLPLKGLTIEVTLAGATAVGVMSGAGGSYNYSKDWLRMYPMGMGTEGIKTFIHELGHRYYYKNLTKKVREAWDKAIRRRQVEVKDHHIDSFFAKYVGDIDNESFNRKKTDTLIKKNENDPTLKAIYLFLTHNFPRWYQPEDEDKKTHYMKKTKEHHSGDWIDLEFVTEYAATKPNEAFAEVFAHWVIKRNTLGEWTRTFFKDIVRTGGANIKEEKEMDLIEKYLSEAKFNKQKIDFIMDQLSNDEYSSDAELILHIAKETGISIANISSLVKKERQMFRNNIVFKANGEKIIKKYLKKIQ